MKIVYKTPQELRALIDSAHKRSMAALKLAFEERAIMRQLGEALEEANDRVARGLPVGITIDPVCEKCNDTHKMSWQDSNEVMCIFCPTPCEKCRGNLSAYCAGEPCPCDCHKKGT